MIIGIFIFILKSNGLKICIDRDVNQGKGDIMISKYASVSDAD